MMPQAFSAFKRSHSGNFSIFRGNRGLSLSKAVGFDRLNQLRPTLPTTINRGLTTFGN